MNTAQTTYYTQLAAAFVRGSLYNTAICSDHPELFAPPLDSLGDEELWELFQLGITSGLQLHRFKRALELPRVRKVLGLLKGLQPANMLDIGSGRGVFLWPLLDTFPYLPITTVDLLPYRVTDMQAVHVGGIANLDAHQADVTELPFPDRAFEVVTMLEVLEHIPNTEQALAEVCRVARRFIIFSVPSKEDDNPEHIHLFDQQRLTQLLHQQGISCVTFDYVPNHMIALARIEKS